MKTWKVIVIAIGLLVALSSCAPDPRKAAEAEKIRLEAEAAAANAKQAREFAARIEADEAAKAEWARDVRDASLAEAQKAGKFVVWSFAAGACLVIAFGSFTAKNTVDMVGKAIGNYALMYAEVQSQLIHMDEKTRTYPAFTVRTVDGSRILTVISSGQKFLMDGNANPADPRLVAALAQVSASGVLAQAASNPKTDAAGIAMINPTVIDLEV